MKVLRDARLTECCGQHYCDSCLRKWLERNMSCPQCRTVGFPSILDKPMIREINEFKVYCTHKNKGCKWVGELESLKHHLESDNGCGYVMVRCGNSTKDLPTVFSSSLSTIIQFLVTAGKVWNDVTSLTTRIMNVSIVSADVNTVGMLIPMML